MLLFANAYYFEFSIYFLQRKYIYYIYVFNNNFIHIYILFTYAFTVRRTIFIVESGNILINNNNN